MARYSAGARSTGAGSTTLPVFGLCPGSANDIHVIEIGVSNTTATAVSLAVRRWTTAGTPGSGLSEVPWDVDTTAATAAALDTYTSTGPTMVSGVLAVGGLGAAVGSAWAWTFGGYGLRVAKGSTNANGIGVLPLTGTGQILDWYIVWDE